MFGLPSAKDMRLSAFYVMIQNKEAYVFINNCILKNKSVAHHFLGVILKGNHFNVYGFVSKVMVYQKGQVQLLEQMPVRSYLSSVDRTLFFGLGSNTVVDSLVVIWPNDTKQTLTNVKADQVITLFQKNANGSFFPSRLPDAQLFTDVTTERHVSYQHRDVPGGGFNAPGKLFVQNAYGLFQSKNQVPKDPMQEDADCLFFDADGDSDQYLLITYGDVRSMAIINTKDKSKLVVVAINNDSVRTSRIKPVR